MGTRKRAGKNRHKGKGRRRYSRNTDSCDEDDPVSSGVESDTEAEQINSHSSHGNKATRQRHNKDSDSNGTTPVDIDDAVPVTWTILFIGALIILSLCTIVMTYFVVRTYNAPDIIKSLNPFTSSLESSESTHDFSHDQATEEQSATENCDNGLQCSESIVHMNGDFEDDADDKTTFTDTAPQEKICQDKLETDLLKTDDEDVFSEDEIDLEKRADSRSQDPGYIGEIIDETGSDNHDSKFRTVAAKISESEEEEQNTAKITVENQQNGDTLSLIDSVVDENSNKIDKIDSGEMIEELDIKQSKFSSQITPESKLVAQSHSTEDCVDLNGCDDVVSQEQGKISPESSPGKEPLDENETPNIITENSSPVDDTVEQDISEESPFVELDGEENIKTPAEESLKEPSIIAESSSDGESEKISNSFPTEDSLSDSMESAEGHVGEVDTEQESTDPSESSENKNGGGESTDTSGCTSEDDESCEVKSSPAKSGYSKADFTNAADNLIRYELDEADHWLDTDKVDEAHDKYNHILSRYPRSPRAVDGLAQSLCKLAELQQSNKFLEDCIEQYLKLLETPDVPQALMLRSGRACVGRQQFRGWGQRAVKVLKRLIDKYPKETALLNELGVQYLMVGRSADAKTVFKQMLKIDPGNFYAKAHVGFILKTTDDSPELAVPLLREALLSDDSAVQDGRFYFHLGDALQRLGNVTEARDWYEKGAKLGLLRSQWQRSLYNVEHLTGRPWWTQGETGQTKLIKELESNWEMIRDEGMSNIDKSGSFKPEEERLREKGNWGQLTLFHQGRKNEENCKKAPKTCRLIEKFPDAASCKRGQVKFSVMHPGVHVWPHCGPTNCRIRMHLGLSVPKDCCKIRVVEDIRTWEEGKVIIFDDSFEHEVWHDGNAPRLVLIVDIWHPELTARHKAALSPI